MSMHRVWIALAVCVGCGQAGRGPAPAMEPPAIEPPLPTAEVPADIDAAVAPDPILAAVQSPARPEEDRARDGDRRPHEVLSFFGIGPGDKVAEMMAGRGYYVEILARAVGPQGVVYAHNNAFVVQRFAGEALDERLGRPGLDHVIRLDRELEDPGLPRGELDAVLMFLFYHDTFWMNADRARMNQAIFDALVPGGVFGVIDHHAEVGSGPRDVKSLHRIDAELVKAEILAAGFVLDGESDLLRHAADDRTTNVFDPEMRGKTDRFVYRFRKPAARDAAAPAAAPSTLE
jgi:predicted methyltransferase